VKVTEQLALPPPPETTQGDPEKDPAPDEAKLTVPVGVMGVALVSVTVAVQLEAWPNTSVLGVHDTPIVVASTAWGCGAVGTPDFVWKSF